MLSSSCPTLLFLIATMMVMQLLLLLSLLFTFTSLTTSIEIIIIHLSLPHLNSMKTILPLFRSLGRLEMDLMDKVRQVGENYELNKYKALNKTVELDARLANDRLLATKLRLSQVSSLNDKLGKQLRLVQQQYRVQEKKLLLTETMLRQLVDSRAERSHHHHHHSHKAAATTAPAAPTTSRLARFRGRRGASQQQKQQQQQVADSNEKNASSAADQTNIVKGQPTEANSNLSSGNITAIDPTELTTLLSTTGNSAAVANVRDSADATGQVVAIRKVSNSATQTQMSRTKTIISDLRQRLNLVGSKGE